MIGKYPLESCVIGTGAWRIRTKSLFFLLTICFAGTREAIPPFRAEYVVKWLAVRNPTAAITSVMLRLPSLKQAFCLLYAVAFR